MYINYESALEMTGLDTLRNRREKRCLNFSLKSAKHDRNQRLFPLVDDPSYKMKRENVSK
jgi:hypothetical protein